MNYNDPRIIRAIYRHDPQLAELIESWEYLDWFTQKRIWLTVICYAWKARFLAWWKGV